jgi:hypothetical protein
VSSRARGRKAAQGKRAGKGSDRGREIAPARDFSRVRSARGSRKGIRRGEGEGERGNPPHLPSRSPALHGGGREDWRNLLVPCRNSLVPCFSRCPAPACLPVCISSSSSYLLSSLEGEGRSLPALFPAALFQPLLAAALFLPPLLWFIDAESVDCCFLSMCCCLLVL